ncbi:helix-turn-helix domain-containing protein [Streptomyces sp. NBC_00847]|uniref:helix-turn-helix domain-containing protein n=1 Tax=Streptomyces sp. NBC_00847 TaxID=2975850 RepID=UPI0022513E52|nr:helix-turn-helix transcriptional regulator [Streptomyces sp. NBC_00847]MCX4882405.1 helix-turn-helix domain-containing protein [Streptomyces sp. NBC_00847]
MRSMDPLWSSAQARTLVDHQDPGGLVRLGRVGQGWRQADLGARLGCSASTVSRMEQRGSRTTDLHLLRRAAQEVGVPPQVLGAALGLNVMRAIRVAADGPRHAKEDPMRRRTLLAAAGLAAPAQLLAGVDEALAVTPGPTGSTVPLDTRLARARSFFDAGRHMDLLKALPGLLADAHDAARSRSDLAHARLSSCYSLATQLLIKIGRYDRARLTADRATVYAELSGASLAAAAAARELSIVLRHQDQQGAAQRLLLGATAKVEATGLTTLAQSAAYAQMLCTTAYTAARAGDRDQALSMIREASQAACGLPKQAPAGRLFPITPAAVDLYAVGVHWALGDAGAAIQVGGRLRAAQFPTAERKGRMHTDLGRAWWQWGKPEQTANELLSALRISPGEVRDRPAIRQIVSNLSARHPRVIGVRELSAAVGVRDLPPTVT